MVRALDDAGVAVESLDLVKPTLDDVFVAKTGRHLEEVKTVADELGLGFLGLGFSPLWRRDEVPVMPKARNTTTPANWT